MLYTKFESNRPARFGEEDFERVFIIYGHGGHLGQRHDDKFSFF